MREELPVPDAVTVAMRRGLERCRRLPAQPFDIWVPQVSTDVGGLVRDGRLEVFLLADDGNQLVGCVRVQSEDPLGTGWGAEVKHSFRRMGYRLAQAALDAGMHRTITLLLVVPDAQQGKARTTLSSEEVSEAEFRSLLLTDQEVLAPDKLDQALEPLAPLPGDLFLDLKPESTLAEDLPILLTERNITEDTLMYALQDDVREYLEQGHWSGQSWAKTLEWMDGRLRNVMVASGPTLDSEVKS